MTIIAVPSARTIPPRTRSPSERRSLSRSATRALDVLECFGAEQRWLRAIEIARMLGLQGSTTNQLLKTMVDSAHLVFDARNKAYYPSPRMIGFASFMTGAFGSDDRLSMLMRDLQVRTGLAVSLTSPNGAFMQILRMDMPAGQSTERGLHVGLFGSAVGSAYLATLDDKDIKDIAMRAGLDRAPLPTLMEMARKVREDGFASGVGPDPAIWTVATAIPRGMFPVPMVLAIAGRREDVDPRSTELAATMAAALKHWLAPQGV